jgi:hypothetical protein
MKINVTPFHFEELINKSYSLDLIFLLKLIYEKYEIKTLCESNEKIKLLHQTLIRKGLITETEDKITTVGQDLLIFLDTKEPKRLAKRKVDNSVFDEWWKEFPGTDTFLYKGKKFSGCRSLRANKDDCRIKFDKIISEGEYTAVDLIRALKYDVQQKREVSFRTGANKITYMQNSLTYLNQRSYEPFIELTKNTELIEEEKCTGGTVDI